LTVGDAELLAELSRLESYPAPRPTRVEVRSTHISWVFLTDDAAWKVKRPVRLPFLDFSTPELRRRFCDEELRLNRRLAPEVYLEVVPIHHTSHGHSFVGPGPVVDHAVKMRRLDDSASAAARLAAGQLGCAHLAALSRRLAAFYAAQPSRPEDGSLACITHLIEENLDQLQAFVPELLDRESFDVVAGAARRDLQRHAGRFGERCTAGRIREGHGDLRLEHAYFPASGEVQVIDAVEFSERFRTGDVALDIAFLAMELEAAGHVDLATYFVYRFARDSNDYALYPLLDFYLGYRALVRAKIAALIAADPATPGDKASRKRQEARRLMAVARGHAERTASPPLVIAVGGLTGAGKSTLAETLARAGLGPVISSDATRKHLAGLAPTDRGSAALYTPAFSARTHHELLQRATEVISGGRDVILDATFRTADERAHARQLAADRGGRFLFIEATCEEATLRERLRARAQGPSESDADEAVLARVRAEYQSPAELPAAEYLPVPTDRPERDPLPEIRARLRTGAAPRTPAGTP
jgi:uncharacterized protein